MGWREMSCGARGTSTEQILPGHPPSITGRSILKQFTHVHAPNSDKMSACSSCSFLQASESGEACGKTAFCHDSGSVI